MAQLIGTDEAGYGPNLGPLTICGSAWEVDDPDIDLYSELESAVESEVADDKLTIADSKAVFTSGRSLVTLETTVLSLLNVIHGVVPNDVAELASALSGEIAFSLHEAYSECSAKINLPLVASRSKIERLADTFNRDCESRAIRLCELRCTAIFPDRFNQLLLAHGNKAELLSISTLQMVNDLSNPDADSIRIVCDKHGGRNKYLGMINKCVTDEFVSVDCESRQLSRYFWREDQRLRELNFLAGGESFLPTALASMTAKYVREIAMKIWNEFWLIHIPEIRPTSGYPVDARRFKRDIYATQLKLGISDESIWRNS